MGSERSSKEKKRSRTRSYDSSASDEEGKDKRHKGTDQDEERGSKRSHKKERKKDKRSHKHRSDKKKKSKDEHKRKHHKDDHHTKHGFPELSSDDYFSKNNEFATWLKEEKGIFFSDLTSESARKTFSGFVKAWNSGKLEARYYEGITSGPRTAHNWKIKQ